jgi:hypothetical protein
MAAHGGAHTWKVFREYPDKGKIVYICMFPGCGKTQTVKVAKSK